MPSAPQAAGSSAPCAHDHTPAGIAPSPAFQLAQASRALWMATLSLMTAFMQTQAPAHRYLLARRISRNFETLSRQDCFDSGCRSSFARLAGRWQSRSEQFAPAPQPASRGFLSLFS